MSLLPKNFPFQESSINDVKDLDDMKRVFGDFVKEFFRWYAKLYDNIENGGFETNSWRVKEAFDDATYAPAITGDLLFQRKIAGIWTTVWIISGS